MSYDNLTIEEQLQRLTQLAIKAAEPYHFDNPKLTLIKHGMNTVYKIQTKSGESYVLRIHPQKWLGYQAIHSEVNFVREIARNTGLSVAEPVIAQNGLFVQETASDGVPGTRFSVVFQWLDGVQKTEKLSNEDLILAGEYLGRLHLFCETFTPAEGFVRPRLDTEGIFGKIGMYNPGNGIALFSEEQKSIFSECLDLFREELGKLGEGKDQFGMVHGDYYFLNWMFNSGSISTFDYDICGWGYYLYDIVMPYWPDNQASKMEAYEYFLQGYSKVRRVPDGFEEYRTTFDSIRRLMEAYWVVTRRDLPQLEELIPTVLNTTACYLKDFLKSR